MNITIKKLTPELVEDYLHFFDVTPHSTGNPEHKCYCVCWASTEGDPVECASARQRRIIAQAYIVNQYIQGYLAYHGDTVVGWCNANTKSKCYRCIAWKMFMGDIQRDDSKVKSVFCFAIKPEYRKKGIAFKLLERVCDDAKLEGFDCIEAYPNTDYIDDEKEYMGPVAMFEKAGFIQSYKMQNRIVMIKNLREHDCLV